MRSPLPESDRPLSRLQARPTAVLFLAIATLVSGCALPGRPERVLPGIEGTLYDGGTPVDDGHLALVVIHSKTAAIHSRREVSLGPERPFRFEPLFLDVAGQEFGLHYRLYLHLVRNGADRVIWRARLSRWQDEVPIRLTCDLARPIALGEPCRVVDPLTQPWLLAEGKRHFERLCADCHGADARGGTVRPSLSPTESASHAPDLTRIAARQAGRFDRDAVAIWIEGRSLPDDHVRGAMPVWGERLSSEFEKYAEGDALIGATLDPLLGYLESIQRRD
jgi:mono/diheme cytochrome c family protein